MQPSFLWRARAVECRSGATAVRRRITPRPAFRLVRQPGTKCPEADGHPASLCLFRNVATKSRWKIVPPLPARSRWRSLSSDSGRNLIGERGAVHMARILAIVAFALLLTGRALAQSDANCEEIRQAVATYGYEEARRHAMAHYGAEAVEAGERKCLNKGTPAKEVTKASLKGQKPKARKVAGPPMQLKPK
jgi:hypothetical protein